MTRCWCRRVATDGGTIRMPRPWSRKLAADDGSTLPLIIFFGMLSLVLILLVVAATSLYLERKRLFTVADGAALVGAEAFELADVGPTSEGYRPTLSSGEVASAVDET